MKHMKLHTFSHTSLYYIILDYIILYFGSNCQTAQRKGWNNYIKKSANANFRWITSFRLSFWCLMMTLSSIKLYAISIVLHLSGKMALIFISNENYPLDYQVGCADP